MAWHLYLLIGAQDLLEGKKWKILGNSTERKRCRKINNDEGSEELTDDAPRSKHDKTIGLRAPFGYFP